jgi:hypothetical protein
MVSALDTMDLLREEKALACRVCPCRGDPVEVVLAVGQFSHGGV